MTVVLMTNLWRIGINVVSYWSRSWVQLGFRLICKTNWTAATREQWVLLRDVNGSLIKLPLSGESPARADTVKPATSTNHANQSIQKGTMPLDERPPQHPQIESTRTEIGRKYLTQCFTSDFGCHLQWLKEHLEDFHKARTLPTFKTRTPRSRCAPNLK